MNFSEALLAAKAGQRITRTTWGDRWVSQSPGGRVPASQMWNAHTQNHAHAHGGQATVDPYFLEKTLLDTITMGWAPTQDDMLADDWLAMPN